MPASQGKAYRGMGMEGPIARWYARQTGKQLDQFQAAARAIADRVPNGGVVLEVAPGPGYFAIELAKLGPYRITGLDISETFVRMALENAKAAGVGVAFRRGNASAMPFESDSFDAAFCRAAFKNFSEPVQAIREMHRVLKPGGLAVVADLRRDAPPDAIDAAIKEMRLSRINSWITKWTFRHLLLKRAYSEEDFRRMVAETPFGTAEVKRDQIGLEIWLRK